MTTSFMVTLLSEKAGVMEYWSDGFFFIFYGNP
jgi:hypothetical protein